MIAFCNTGGNMENAVKQAREFGLGRGGRAVAPMFGFMTEMKAVGLETGQGLFMTETFYWDLNDRTRAFTRRFLPKSPGNYPCSLHAGCYSASAAAMAWKAARLGDADRLAMAGMVLRHRVLPRDPLAAER